MSNCQLTSPKCYLYIKKKKCPNQLVHKIEERRAEETTTGTRTNPPPLITPPTTTTTTTTPPPPPLVKPNLKLFSTGIADDGTPLPRGALDPHYKVLVSPLDSNGVAIQTGNPVVGGIGGTWIPDDAESSWIGKTGTPGVYVYETTFDLTGYLPNTAVLKMYIAGDDGVWNTYLNNTNLDFGWRNYSVWSPEKVVTSGFLPGVNRLHFEWNAGGGAGGFRARLQISATLA